VVLILSGSHCFADVNLPEHQDAVLPVDGGLTLAGATDIALANYPQVLKISARTDEARAWSNRGQSWLADRPTATFRYQTDRFGPDNGLQEYEAGISLPLWNPGGRASVRRLGEALTTESEAAAILLRWEVAGLLRSAFWDIALADNEHELAEEALATADRLTRSVERRYELGDVALSDVLLARSSFLDAQTTLIAANASLLDAERYYRSVTGLERRPPFDGELLSVRTDIDPDHPALEFANAEVERATAAVSMVEKTVQTGASVLIGPRSERAAFAGESDESVGITLTIPFGGSVHRQTEISAAARVAANARAARNQKLRMLTLALHEAAHSLNVVHQNLAAASDREALSERHQAMGEIAYEKGELDLIDLIKLQSTTISAKRQVTLLQIDEKRQTAFYNQAVGDFP
jgi:outer membrane protein TolC